MNKIIIGHLWGNGQMVMHINLTEFGQGWHYVEIPITRRRQALQMLGLKIEQYKSSSSYRNNIGSGHNIDTWLNNIVTQIAV